MNEEDNQEEEEEEEEEEILMQERRKRFFLFQYKLVPHLRVSSICLCTCLFFIVSYAK